jgi:hypothetical protein
MFPGQIQKFTLDGKVVGQFGTAGRKLGQFGWAHALGLRRRKRHLDRRIVELARSEVRAASERMTTSRHRLKGWVLKDRKMGGTQ